MVSTSVRNRGRELAAAITSSIVRTLASGKLGSIDVITRRTWLATDKGSPVVFTAMIGVEVGSSRYGMNNSVPVGLSRPAFFISATTPTTVHQGSPGALGRTRLPMAR